MMEYTLEQGAPSPAGTYRYLVKPEDTQLLLINLQERFIEAMELECRDTFLKNTRILIRTAQALGIPILASEQMPEDFGRTVDEIGGMIGDAPRIEKASFSCWREGEIRAQIRKSSRKTVIVAGLEAHVCVLLTVMDLISTGYHPILARDAICSRKLYSREMAVHAMAHAGAVIYPTETIAFMLLDKAGTPVYEEALTFLDWDIPKASAGKKA